jgi:hypothetical protein
MGRVSSLGCIVCKIHHRCETPAEIHHLNGKTGDGCHFNVIPLCPTHHRGGVDTDFATSRHPYKARFESRYGTDEELLVKVCELLGETVYE